MMLCVDEVILMRRLREAVVSIGQGSGAGDPRGGEWRNLLSDTGDLGGERMNLLGDVHGKRKNRLGDVGDLGGERKKPLGDDGPGCNGRPFGETGCGGRVDSWVAVCRLLRGVFVSRPAFQTSVISGC